MKYVKLILITIFMLILASCSTPVNLTNNISFKENKSDVHSISSISDAVNVSGLNILKSCAEKDSNKNIIISPLSIYTAFSLLSNGAQGETKDEIYKAFYLNKDINNNMNNLLNYLNQSNNETGYENTGYINIYNSVWFDSSFKVADDFINISKSYYNSDIFKEKLSDNSTVNDMNKWVYEKSDGLIKKPFEKLSDDDRMLLVNLVNFKGKWTNKFDKSKTKEDNFYLKDNSQVKTPFMNKEGMEDYYEDKEVKACTLNYYNGRMIVLLPTINIDDYLNKLTVEKINTYTLKGKNTILKLEFPKFKIEYKNNLNETLMELGIKKAFDPKGAEFNLMHEDNDPLWVGKVLHDCVIDVDEEGTQGAALTSVRLCGAALPKDTHEMYVNKPFIFIIQDKTGTCLFMGKVENVKQ